MAKYIIVIAALAALIGWYTYRVVNRILRFYGLNPAGKAFKAVNIAVSAAAALISINVRRTEALIVLHLVVLYLLLDLAAWAVRTAFRARKPGKIRLLGQKLYGCGLVPIAVTAGLMIYGAVNMGHVVRTAYTVETDKQVGDYTLALITDTHYGTIQSKAVLREKIAEINAGRPDLVILGGDIVEEGTSKEDMQEVFALLGGLESKYGIYYVYGNHDRQPYTSRRSYSNEELEQAITANGITILKDSCVEINEDLLLAGREDASQRNVSGRASVEELLEGANRERYTIVVDHQPVEAGENDAQGVDLELSGHTHAGQIWPVGSLLRLIGRMNYGEYQSGDCTVIVSSGFTGWGYPVRTEKHCEYVMIRIKGNAGV